MKTSNNAPAKLTGGNREAVEELAVKTKLGHAQLGLLLLVADMLDTIAEGQVMYMTIGATRNRSAFSCTIHGDQVPAPFYASDIKGLNIAAGECL